MLRNSPSRAPYIGPADTPAVFRFRSEPGTRRQILDAFLGAFLTLWTTSVLATEWQAHADIAQVAEIAAAEMLPPAAGRRTLQAGPIDQRLRMPLCSVPMQAETPASLARGERMTVLVSCAEPQAWRLHVPVAIAEMAEVVVARGTLPADSVLEASHLALEERDVTQLRQGYLNETSTVIGQRLRRSMSAGQVLQPAMLKVDPLVRRGQRVTLFAASGMIEVKMAGLALANGAEGQRIPVRNLSSEREIEGVVRSAQRVEVLLK